MREFKSQRLWLQMQRLRHPFADSSYPRPKPLPKLRELLESRSFSLIVKLLTITYIVLAIAIFYSNFPTNIPNNSDIILIGSAIGKPVLQHLSVMVIILIVPILFVLLYIFLKSMARKDAIREYAVLRLRS